MTGGWLTRIRGLVGWGSSPTEATRSAVDGAESEALRLLSARPAHSPAELQRQLHLEGDAFIAIWEGKARLPAGARRRLIGLLSREEERVRELRLVLENPDRASPTS